MANAKISALNEVTGSNLDDEDVLAIVNATETKKVKFNELISTAGLNKLSGTPIPSAKVAFASGSIVEASMATNSVNTAAVKDDNITGAKLANNATALFASSAPTAEFTGQLWVDTDDDKLYIWDGSSWDAVVAGTTTISGSTSGLINIVSTASGTTYTISATIDDTDAAAKFLAGPTGAAGAVSARTIVGTDLPTATSSALGAIKVNGEGLRMDTGVIEIDNDVTATGTHSVVTVSAKGLITGSRAITAADLPNATSSAIGGVKPGTGLAVSSGTLNHSNSATAGTYTKLTIDAVGHVTSGTTLADSDLPNHSAALLTSGTLPIARIADDAITAAKMANSSTCIVQSISQAGFPTAAFTGQLLFDSVAEDAYLWDGNAWQAITTLTKGSLVNGGTFNASTSKMASVTTAGSAAGLVVGSNLPTPTATTDGVYVVVATAGTPSSPAPVVSLNPPDYILGVTNAAGSSWNEIDLSATVSGQTAANVSFTPYGQLSSTNCQDVIEELETEKLGKAGGEITGELLIGAAGSLVFEGATANAYETTLTVTDPSSADRTATLPDASGTIVLQGNAQIVNADISTSAAIALSKLANVTSTYIIVGSGSNVPTAVALSGDVSITNAGVATVVSGSTSAAGKLQLEDSAASTSTTKAATPAAVKVAKDAADAAATTANAALPKAGGTATGHINLDNDQELRLMEADSNGSAYVGIKGATDKGAEASYTISLPAAAPTANQVLKANSSTPTTLEWAADATNVAAGDLTGTTMASNVVTSSLTTVGTVASGTWAATDVAISHGGTGSSTAAGALSNLGAAALAGATFTGNVNLGVDDTGVDLKLFGATAGAYVLWDESADELLTGGGATVNIVKDKLKIGGTAVTTTAAELNVLDGFTGDVDDLIYAKDLKATGVTSTEFDYLDGVTSAIQTQFTGKAALAGATFTGNVNLGVDDTGVDLKLFGATAGAYILWDESADKLLTGGGAVIDVVKDKFLIGGTAVTTTAAELNLLDGVTAIGDVTLTGSQTLTNKTLTTPTITTPSITGIDLAGCLREGATITAGKLSDNTNIDLANGMVHLFTTQETTTCTPNIRVDGSTTLNATMAVGEAISVTIITTANGAGYSAQLTIDGSAVTENWVGGSAPDAGGGSGVDIYTYNIIKTASATYTVIANLTKTSS